MSTKSNQNEIFKCFKFFNDLQQGIIPAANDRKIITAASRVCPDFCKKLEIFNNKINDDVSIVDTLNMVSLQMDDIFQSCSITNHIECSKIFIRSLTFFGSCFTFNMLGYHSLFNANLSADFDAYKRKNITKSWKAGSLTEYHNNFNESVPSNWEFYNGYATDGDWDQPLRASGSQNLKVFLKTNFTEFPNYCKSILKSYIFPMRYHRVLESYRLLICKHIKT